MNALCARWRRPPTAANATAAARPSRARRSPTSSGCSVGGKPGEGRQLGGRQYAGRGRAGPRFARCRSPSQSRTRPWLWCIAFSAEPRRAAALPVCGRKAGGWGQDIAGVVLRQAADGSGAAGRNSGRRAHRLGGLGRARLGAGEPSSPRSRTMSRLLPRRHCRSAGLTALPHIAARRARCRDSGY